MAAFAGRRPPPADRFDRRMLPPMMLGAILNPINSSIIAVALVPIAVALGAPASETAWLVSALYLATAVGQPLVGQLVDTYGPKRIFLAGATLTLIAGLVGAFAPNIWVLVAARVVLGFGTCAGFPSAMSLIRSESARTGMKSPAGILTVLSITTQTIAVIGPTFGGILIGIGGWRSTLAINILLGAACLVLGWLFLPTQPAAAPGTAARRVSIDILGILLFAGSLVALLLFLAGLKQPMFWLLAIAVAAGAGFGWCELRRADPFIDVRVFAGNLPLLATYARTFVAAIVSYSFIYGFTQWLQQGRGLSPTASGLVLIPTFAVGIAVTAATGRRAAVRGKLIVGSIAQVAACTLLLFLDDASPVWLLLVIMVVLGIPQGLVGLANQNAVYFQADPEKIGTSAGLLRTSMYLGAIAASSATGLFFGQKATTAGLHDLAVFTIAMAVVFFVLTVFDRTLGRIGRDPGGRTTS